MAIDYHYMPYLGPIPTRPPQPAWDHVSYQPQPMYDMQCYFPTYRYPYDPYAAYTHALPPPPAPQFVHASANQGSITSAHNTIGQVLEDLKDLVKEFRFPARLDFSEPSSDGQVPRLADTRRNKPVADYRSSLEYLLDILNGVQSYGDRGVKKAREEAVRRVREELEVLKMKKVAAWKNVSE